MLTASVSSLTFSSHFTDLLMHAATATDEARSVRAYILTSLQQRVPPHDCFLA
jgi:hypothetical protein